MDENDNTNHVKKLCAIVEDRDKILLVADVKIKYYKNAIESAGHEIKALENERNRIADEDKAIDKQSEQLEFIENSVRESQQIGMQSLRNHQILEKMVNKELDVKRQKTNRVQEEFQDIYSEVKTKLTENPLYKELEAERNNFLKVDIHRHIVEVKIRNKKQIIAQTAAIQKKIYYNFWVRIAKHHLIEKKTTELQHFQMQNRMAIKKLYTLQENAKLRRKLGTPGDKMKSMTKINFGSQDPTSLPQKSIATSKPVVRPQPIRAPQSIGEKLNSLYQQDEPKQVEIPQKIRIIEEQVLVPAFVVPQFPEPKKRKAQTIDLSKRLLNMVRSHSSMKRVSSSQSSQHSQLSQKSQENQVPVEPATLQPSLENPLTESCVETNLSVKYSQECQKMPPIFVKNNVAAKSHESQMSLAQTSEPILNQYQMVESLNHEDELMQIGDNPEPNSPASIVQASNRIMNPQSVLNSPDNKLSQKGIIKPLEEAPKMSFGEPNKSVRFNLDWGHEPKENKGMFGQSMFGNPFGSFMNRTVPKQNPQNDSVEQATNANNSFNMSMLDNTREDFHTGMEFESGGNLRSPEYSYNMEGEGEEEHQFKAPGFGGGFSFASKSMFNFP